MEWGKIYKKNIQTIDLVTSDANSVITSLSLSLLLSYNQHYITGVHNEEIKMHSGKALKVLPIHSKSGKHLTILISGNGEKKNPSSKLAESTGQYPEQ